MPDTVIMKIQASIYSTAAASTVLIYNEDRAYMLQGPLMSNLEEFLNGRLKVFAEVEVAPLKTGQINIVKEVDDPGW